MLARKEHKKATHKTSQELLPDETIKHLTARSRRHYWMRSCAYISSPQHSSLVPSLGRPWARLHVGKRVQMPCVLQS